MAPQLAAKKASAALFDHPDRFVSRHVGPNETDVAAMLDALGLSTLDELVDGAVPAEIRLRRPLYLPAAQSEAASLEHLHDLASANQVYRSFIGMGYSDCHVPPVVLRNILENPNWYTQYTPYQAEISQGRLEMLLNFQTMVAELTGLPIAGASLLDEGTAVAEAVSMAIAVNAKAKSSRFLVHERLHPQSLAVLATRAEALDIELVVGDPFEADLDKPFCGALVQTPDTDGRLIDVEAFAARVHAAGGILIVATDLLACTIVRPPGECGADIVIGSAQRFGVPMGYGGPHAAFLACKDEFKRQMPGRIIGQTRTQDGGTALRLALQTREQHIRREKATSNICTAQVLLAVMAAAYAIYHGPNGLAAIASRLFRLTSALRSGLEALGYGVLSGPCFDTLRVAVKGDERRRVLEAAEERRMNLRCDDPRALGVALDETTDLGDIADLLAAFAAGNLATTVPDALTLVEAAPSLPEGAFARATAYLTHPTFSLYRSETEMLRYLTRLQSRDLSLTTSMIPLGSCTMKLNAAAEMLPITWPGFARMHPFAPVEQAKGWQRLFTRLEADLAEITGFHRVSLQPNAGSQGEYAGLLVIRAFHAARGESRRDVCLIPASAHGTNPASAVMAGFKVVVVKNLADGRIDVADLEARAKAHADRLAAIMVTYPSTYGVFESTIVDVCRIVHEHGGQVYLDGANLNAQMGLCRPGDYGADVCHLNLHKTFCIPHGGGGPGMGPIGVAPHLAPFLPGHPVITTGGPAAIGPVSAAPWGSAGILPISYAYIRMCGAEGLRRSSEVAILNANYMAARLKDHYPVLFRNRNGYCAHEFILDARPVEQDSGATVEDLAKRLMDYGFHAPTVSWPVAGTMMIEPTESESKAECDRLCDALIAIREEAQRIARGDWPRDDNPLKNAPHTAREVCADEWTHPYGREVAAFPSPSTRAHKFWPAVKRADSVYGDRNLIVCACPPTESYEA